MVPYNDWKPYNGCSMGVRDARTAGAGLRKENS
jgi:hypothetical protein